MGYPLVFDVLDYAPATLTHREKLLLVVLADDANNQTRVTYSSVQDPKILHRAKLTRSQLYETLKGLIAKGVLKKITHGQQNATAKYMILPLGPAQSPGFPDTENQAQSPGNRDSDESQSPGMATSESRNGDLRVQETGTPTASTASTASTTSSRKRDRSQQRKQRPSKTAPATGPISGDSPYLADAEQICNHLADTLVATGSNRPLITKKWRDSARLLLDADGITVEKAIAAIDWAHGNDFWQAHILTPMKLREKYDQLRRQAVAERRKGRGWQNPEDQSIYDGDLIEDRDDQDQYDEDLIR